MAHNAVRQPTRFDPRTAGYGQELYDSLPDNRSTCGERDRDAVAMQVMCSPSHVRFPISRSKTNVKCYEGQVRQVDIFSRG